MTKKDILKSTPKFKLCANNVVTAVNINSVLIKFEGNIMNFITMNEKSNNASVFTININKKLI